jgi:pyruvate kinase
VKPFKRDRKTSIIATLGPASLKPGLLDALLKAGMDVARLNFSHGTEDTHTQALQMIRAAAKRARRPLPVLADLPGPKMRVGEIQGDAIELKKGEVVTVFLGSQGGKVGRIPLDWPAAFKLLKKGSLIYLNDGFLQMRVLTPGPRQARCTVLAGGILRSRKGFALPGARLPLHPPTDRDLQLLRFGLSQGVECFGASFVSTVADLKAFRKAAARPIQLVAKLERPEALAHATALCREADAIMIARGDLGVNLPLEQVPLAQKALTRLGNVHQAFTITATQMLQSMTESPRPTRAEAADVANAVLDGSEAVMLSDETAAGRYPLEAVQWMDRIVRAAEKARRPDGRVHYRLG